MPDSTNPSLLARLKARYAANAASPDGVRTRQAALIGTFAALVLLGGYRFTHRTGGHEAAAGSVAAEPSFVQGQLPACDSPLARHLLTQAVETNTSPLIGPVKVHKVGQITDYMAFVTALAGGPDAKLDPNPDADMLAARANLQNRRSCAAQVFTSRGQHLYNYAIVWTSDAKDEVYLEAELGQ